MSAPVSRTVIDSLEFAQTGQTLRGSLPVSGLTRLADSLYDSLGVVGFRGAGRARRPAPSDADARRRAACCISQCQRCLGQLDFPLRIGSTVLLVSQAEAAASGLDDEEGEWIEASPELDVASLVEEEIILGLPVLAAACRERVSRGRSPRSPGTRADRRSHSSRRSGANRIEATRSQSWQSSRTENRLRSAACTAPTTRSPIHPWRRADYGRSASAPPHQSQRLLPRQESHQDQGRLDALHVNAGGPGARRRSARRLGGGCAWA